MVEDIFKKRAILCDTWKVYGIQMSASINEVFWEHSHAHSFTDHLCFTYNHRVEWVAETA